MQHLSELVVVRKPQIVQRLIKTLDSSTVHLVVRTVATVYPYHGGLVAVRGRI